MELYFIDIYYACISSGFMFNENQNKLNARNFQRFTTFDIADIIWSKINVQKFWTWSWLSHTKFQLTKMQGESWMRLWVDCWKKTLDSFCMGKWTRNFRQLTHILYLEAINLWTLKVCNSIGKYTFYCTGSIASIGQLKRQQFMPLLKREFYMQFHARKRAQWMSMLTFKGIYALFRSKFKHLIIW